MASVMGFVVPRSYVNNFSDGIERISAAYKERLADALASIDLSQPGAEDVVIGVMRTFCRGSTKDAAYLAKRFYLGLRSRMVEDDGYEGAEEPAYVPEATETATRGIMAGGDATSDGGTAAIVAELQRRLGYETKRASAETMYESGRHDPKRPRFARIPQPSRSYANGCPFCQMLASRGFAYLSEYSAGETRHYHDDCRCVVVPSWERSPRVDGYDRHDYDEGYRRYLDQDHSQHDANVRERRRNRYGSQGRLGAGYSGLRMDQQAAMTQSDRKEQHAKNVQAQHAGWVEAYQRKKGQKAE